MAEDLT